LGLVVVLLALEVMIPGYGLVANILYFLGFQMGFFAEAGPVQIFVSNHVSNLLGLELLCSQNGERNSRGSLN
jgi:hypothetical protein